jgi:hypothetical protein
MLRLRIGFISASKQIIDQIQIGEHYSFLGVEKKRCN